MKISKSAAKFSLNFIIFALCIAASALLLRFFWRAVNAGEDGKYRLVIENAENRKCPNIIIDAGHGASDKT